MVAEDDALDIAAALARDTGICLDSGSEGDDVFAFAAGGREEVRGACTGCSETVVWRGRAPGDWEIVQPLFTKSVKASAISKEHGSFRPISQYKRWSRFSGVVPMTAATYLLTVTSVKMHRTWFVDT